jgi:hypothetical protein
MSSDEILGAGPFGATTIAGGQRQRQPSEIDVDGVRHQGKLIAKTAKPCGKNASTEQSTPPIRRWVCDAHTHFNRSVDLVQCRLYFAILAQFSDMGSSILRNSYRTRPLCSF